MAKKKSAAAQEAAKDIFPHPRLNRKVHGHGRVEQTLEQALKSGRMPHAWLFAGPKGIGKASLAYHFAQSVLAGEGRLYLDDEHPIRRRVVQQSHSDLKVLEEAAGVIKIEEARDIPQFLSLTASEGTHRVVIVDAMDAMNVQAANAILKTLEEPPANTVMLLISHNPGSLLPTIRSRCRLLSFHPVEKAEFERIVAEANPALSAEDYAPYYAMASGSPGLALFLMQEEALHLYHFLLEQLGKGRGFDWAAVHKLGEQLSGAFNAARFETFGYVLQFFFHQLIKSALLSEGIDEVLEGEHAVLSTVAATKPVPQWMEISRASAQTVEDATRIHLDRKLVLLHIMQSIIA